tara:strand:- start:44 stop:247 length:204 start_codon:yes stop_codon:yes gene_type:complete
MNPTEILEIFIGTYKYDDFMEQWLCDNLYVPVTDIEHELYVLTDEEIEELYIDFLVDEQRYSGKNDL